MHACYMKTRDNLTVSHFRVIKSIPQISKLHGSSQRLTLAFLRESWVAYTDYLRHEATN